MTIKILCVEDEKDIRENIADILRDENFEVVEAEDGQIAYQKFLDTNPDVVISDVMMPNASGYDLLKLIRNSKESRKIDVPFILLTALGQKEDVVKGVELSANDYLVKPIDFDLLIAKINEKVKSVERTEELFASDIKNLKTQFSTIVPKELKTHVQLINNITKFLKTQPYGPFPHNGYLEEINRLHISAVKLEAIIFNILDEEVLSKQLDESEDIVNLSSFISDLIKESQLEKFVKFSYKEKTLIKIDKNKLRKILRNIVSFIKLSEEKCISISVIKKSHKLYIAVSCNKEFLNISNLKNIRCDNYEIKTLLLRDAVYQIMIGIDDYKIIND